MKQPNQLLNGEYGAWRTLGFRSSDAEKLHAGDAKALSKAYTEDAFVSLLSKKAMLAESAKDSVCGHFQWLFVSHENPGRVQPDEAYRRIDKVGDRSITRDFSRLGNSLPKASTGIAIIIRRCSLIRLRLQLPTATEIF